MLRALLLGQTNADLQPDVPQLQVVPVPEELLGNPTTVNQGGLRIGQVDELVQASDLLDLDVLGVGVLALDYQVVDLGLSDEEEVLGDGEEAFAAPNC